VTALRQLRDNRETFQFILNFLPNRRCLHRRAESATVGFELGLSIIGIRRAELMQKSCRIEPNAIAKAVSQNINFFEVVYFPRWETLKVLVSIFSASGQNY
jgi:hypothetical protein